ncbi:MAG: excinuclease ABC subunit UvrB [Candidatus Roizmanbacteria bacterium]|nr:MAG: excinuclease ABC subunit UvrB [Candidatus Roizmanbacteria bacterium]
MQFTLTSKFSPTGDQPQAIEKLSEGIKTGLKNQVLLGVTGSGKTFTMANMIEKLQMPALIISHNKTLAGQLYQEMRDFFPENAVSYFVSYYDYYQPEAYMPQTDTYIEKEAQINELIDKLRLQSATNILTRKDAIVVASVSCIYNIGSPVDYGKYILNLAIGDKANWNSIAYRLVELMYCRAEFEFGRGTFRIRGESMDIYPAYEDYGYRVKSKNGIISEFVKFEPLTGNVIASEARYRPVPDEAKQSHNGIASSPSVPRNDGLKSIIVYPAKQYLTDKLKFDSSEQQIRTDLKKEYDDLKNQGKDLEAHRLLKKVNYDLEMIKEVGYVNGIENYSRYLDDRRPGDPPYSLVDYFTQAYGKNFLVFIDESHMTVPQLRGMYNGDFSRKKTLIDFGFRMKAAYDNRPLKFEEFYRLPPHIIYVSATPDEWEINQSKTEVKTKVGNADLRSVQHDGVVEQLIRPTGIIDPQITVRPSSTEIPDLVEEIAKRVKLNQKILVTTLTKKTAEDLTEYLKDKQVRASYLHSDIQTLERSDVLDNLRKNEFDVLIGVNLLREGLDLPEVFLVAILDADKEGFLRSKTSLVQTMGRAARNVSGEVIIYADTMTKSIKAAIEEIERRRAYQSQYNKKHNITPTTVLKPIREKIIEKPEDYLAYDAPKSDIGKEYLDNLKTDSLTPYDRKKVVKRLEKEMKKQAEDLNFEMAIRIRDKVRELKTI